jgi:flagellar biosynthesis/type III secretory pathway protein FliH
MQQGMQQGRQEGEKKGEALALQRLLTKRFGTISSDVTAKIAGATVEQIEAWFDLAIDAAQIADVFGGASH